MRKLLPRPAAQQACLSNEGGQGRRAAGKQAHSAKGKFSVFRLKTEEDPSTGAQRVFRLLKINFCNIGLGLGGTTQALVRAQHLWRRLNTLQAR